MPLTCQALRFKRQKDGEKEKPHIEKDRQTTLRESSRK